MVVTLLYIILLSLFVNGFKFIIHYYSNFLKYNYSIADDVFDEFNEGDTVKVMDHVMSKNFKGKTKNLDDVFDDEFINPPPKNDEDWMPENIDIDLTGLDFILFII